VLKIEIAFKRSNMTRYSTQVDRDSFRI